MIKSLKVSSGHCLKTRPREYKTQIQTLTSAQLGSESAVWTTISRCGERVDLVGLRIIGIMGITQNSIKIQLEARYPRWKNTILRPFTNHEVTEVFHVTKLIIVRSYWSIETQVWLLGDVRHWVNSCIVKQERRRENCRVAMRDVGLQKPGWKNKVSPTRSSSYTPVSFVPKYHFVHSRSSQMYLVYYTQHFEMHRGFNCT